MYNKTVLFKSFTIMMNSITLLRSNEHGSYQTTIRYSGSIGDVKGVVDTKMNRKAHWS